MKKLVLSAFLLASTQLLAQSFTERVVFSTGGSYGQPGNLVHLLSSIPESGQLDTIASFLGDFSNDVAVLSTQAFVHVGRASGHPAGTDAIYRVDLLSGEVIDSTQSDVAGLQNIEIFADYYLVYNRGFGATSQFLVAKELLDLSNTTYADTDLPASTSGLYRKKGGAFTPDTAYVSYTLNDTGHIGIYTIGSNGSSILGLWHERDVQLDTLAAGIGDIVVSANTLFAVNQRYVNWVPAYNGFTQLNLVNNTFITDTSVVSGMDLYQSSTQGVLGIFNGGLGFIDPMNSMVSPLASITPSDLVLDTNGTNYYAQSTNYFSEGWVMGVNQSGVLSDSLETPISGSAIDLAYNRKPVVQPTLDLYLTNNPDSLLLDAYERDWLDTITISVIEQLSVDASISYSYQSGFISYEIPVALGVVDTVVLEICDRYNKCDTTTMHVYSSMGLNTSERSEFTIYPNPAQDEAWFSDIPQEIKIYNSTGSLIKTLGSSKRLFIGDLPMGVYYVNAIINGEIQMNKLIKQ